MRKLYPAALLLVAALLMPRAVNAQSVVFPQARQAGVAELSQTGDTLRLSNDLLSASFVKTADGHLLFGGCDAMNLLPGTPLFQITLGDGTTYTSNDMTLGTVTTRTLTANASSPKGSDRFPGKEITATFERGNLTVTWHAVLRDGSHYLRTEMDIAASADQPMQGITPMIYNVDVEKAGTVPVKVGNTRGAVLISDKIFAGLETPMGVNSAKIDNTGFDSFTPLAWTAESFVWEPGTETPAGILALKTQSKGETIKAENVLCARGYVTLRSTGNQTFTFTYKGGSHRLNIVGVDITDGDGNVKAYDYHVGYTGNNKSNNVYTLNIPESGAYVLRYFVEQQTETVTSNGTIAFSGKMGTPVLVYDRVAGQKKEVMPRLRAFKPADSDIYSRTGWKVYVDGYTPDNGSGQPEAIIDGDKSTYWHSNYRNGHTTMPHWFIIDMQKAQAVRSLGFTTRQAEKSVNGHIKDYDILVGNDTAQMHKVKSGTLPYTLNEQWVNLDSTVTARYVKVNIRSSQNNAKFAACAELRISGKVSQDQPLMLDDGDTDTQTWTTSTWQVMKKDSVPLRVNELGHYYPDVYVHEAPATFITPRGTLTATFQYASGGNRLQIVGVDLLNAMRDVVASDYHAGATGDNNSNNTYTLSIPSAGQYTLRYIVSMKGERNTSTGSISLSYEVIDTLHLPAPTMVPIEGYWKRPTTLKANHTWNVSAVVGLVAQGQQRRSFLAYSERERAAAWRPMTIYNSWYELNINRNNAKGNGGVWGTTGNYSGNYTSQQCMDVLSQWKTHLFDKYHKSPVAFVWDDGWDEYGTWKFNSNFPQGFKPEDDAAKEMNSGIGAWLGPVGGYGASGDLRRNYWKDHGGMQLSNERYYNYFISCCDTMIKSYDFRYFKFDGISSQFSSVGPVLTDAGIENAEGIIQIERDVRKLRPDIFYNTTVGTWASPFWYHFSDATWRQENDYGTIGVGTDREKWITYRDRLVYQNYVQNSPICPINTLMTHGLILSTHGNVSKDMTYAGILREMRCAFGCGSSMVELYLDYASMNSINGGKLWSDLADCMTWQEQNADVLPDVHWVGGNPWDGSAAHIYGWAAWNGKKVTLTLRNGNTSQQTLTTTLRHVFDIPAYISTSITLKSSFADQQALDGLDTGKAIDIDTPININMPASTVYVFEGVDNGNESFDPVPTAIKDVTASINTPHDGRIYNLQGQQLSHLQHGINIVDGVKVIKK